MKNKLIITLILFQCVMFLSMVLYLQPLEHGGGYQRQEQRALITSLMSPSSALYGLSSSSSSSSSPSSSFELARIQSNGFFDNIHEDDWKRAQDIHARMFPNYVASKSRYDNSNTINDKGNSHKLKNSHGWYVILFAHCCREVLGMETISSTFSNLPVLLPTI